MPAMAPKTLLRSWSTGTLISSTLQHCAWVCDGQLANDVSQGVFLALAKNARELSDRAVLSGWLHRTTQNLAANAVRADVRRRAREQEAAAMNELLTAQPDA